LIKFYPACANLDEGERIYAIGDIHGRADRLMEIYDQIAGDLEARPVRNATIVDLGDYIDRGPDSAAVLELMISPPSRLKGVRRVPLIGNHEALCLRAFDGDVRAETHWLENGGNDCLRSWNLKRETWRAMAPPEHIGFMRGLALTHIQGDYLFVHAGIRPMIAIEEQKPHDLIWIREPFLDYNGPHPYVVVHGHTPESMAPTVRYNRIGIDTGAAYGGPLTCLILEDDRIGFFSSERDICGELV